MNKKDILELIKSHMFINLSTINENGFPECRALVNILNKSIAPHLVEYFSKNEKIYLMTNTSSAKISQILNDSKSSLYFTDHENFMGMLLIGETKEITDNIIKTDLWHDSWSFYYPGGLDGGDFSIIEFIPREYKLYQNLSVEKHSISWK